MIEKEFASFIDSMYKSLDCLWVNSINAINMHKTKELSGLNLMAQNNIRVPYALVTNDKKELLESIEKFNGDTIYKPVQGARYRKN
ncbi:MAG: hypothetical protein MZV64_64720 [Ignavibacteriales bacterium]|nr:hypothetical protein [Ignavibacteriales bacterium]